VLVISPHEAQEGDQIHLVDGEYIYDVEPIDDGWWRGTTADGKRGLFPASYVKESAAPNEAEVPPPLHPVDPQARGPDKAVYCDNPPVTSDPPSRMPTLGPSPGPTQIAGDQPGEEKKQLEQVAEQPKELTKQLEGLVGLGQQPRGEPKYQGGTATPPVVHLPDPPPLPIMPIMSSPVSPRPPNSSHRPPLVTGPSGTTADRKRELLPASNVKGSAPPNEAKGSPPLHPVGATSNPVTSDGEKKKEPIRNGGVNDSESSKSRTSWWRCLCCK